MRCDVARGAMRRRELIAARRDECSKRRATDADLLLFSSGVAVRVRRFGT